MRYAVYFIPELDTPLHRIGSRWLGRDIEKGQGVSPISVPGLDGGFLNTITAEPRRYGLHSTIKPPFRLVDGRSEADLCDAVMAFADRHEPTDLPSLHLAELNGFIALRPKQDCTAINAIAKACVEELDDFRRPVDLNELKRRRAAGLTARQEALLQRWGYPYVFDEFRFHITLTGRLRDSQRARVMPVIEKVFESVVNQPVLVRDLCVAVEPAPGAAFRLLRRFPLRRRG